MKAVNDNLKQEFDHNKKCAVVFLNSCKITFYKILEAKAFIDDYYSRVL
jgi:hypothetical protein